MATNILASWLVQLVQTGMLAKQPYATEQRKEVYRLTEKRVAFMPSLLEVANGSALQVWIDMVNADKVKLTAHYADQPQWMAIKRRTLRSGSAKPAYACVRQKPSALWVLGCSAPRLWRFQSILR